MAALIPLGGCGLLRHKPTDQTPAVQVDPDAHPVPMVLGSSQNPTPAANSALTPNAVQAPATDSLTPSAVATPPLPTEIVTEIDLSGVFERHDLEDTDHVVIQLAYADLSISVDRTRKHGSVVVRRVLGGKDCKAYLHESDDALHIMDLNHDVAGILTAEKISGLFKAGTKSALPPLPDCRFEVELTMHDAAELQVRLRRGSVLLENWTEPSQIKLEWGDVDVGTVADLDVLCGRCNLSGEKISGALRYIIEVGNVGLEGLTGAVEGQTLGDTVLKWSVHPHANNKISLVSRGGDVMLYFPGSTSIAADLKAPRGDIIEVTGSGQSRDSVFRAQEYSTKVGIPLSVMAELGSIRLVH